MLDPRQHRFLIVADGQFGPLTSKTANSCIRYFPERIVGVFDRARFTDVELVLDHGDGLVLYTDGVTEGRGEEGFYGDQRLHDVLSTQRGPAADVAAAVLDSVLRFQGGRATDDIALVVVRVPEAGGA